MGRIARVLSFVRTLRNGAKVSDVKLNPDGGSNITGEHYANPGDDSFPLDTDFAATTKIQGTGREVPVGYIDPLSNPVAQVGEKRIYGRDSAGNPVNEVHLKNDGSIIIDNANGQIEIKADGEIFGSNAGGSISLKPSGDLDIIVASVTKILCPDIQLGVLTLEELVKKNFLFVTYNTHTHPGGGPPVPQALPVNHTINTKGS